MERIRHTIDIDTGPDVVYSAVTSQEGLRGWWTHQAIAEPRVGHENEFPFSSGDFNAMRVVMLEPGRRVEWECTKGAEEWVGTRVVFDLEPVVGGTRLTFSHTDWQEDTPFFRMCRKAWEWYMASLKQYCETGIGTPS
jgi:uncharacterized protein YndB with AHSA1/START domain